MASLDNTSFSAALKTIYPDKVVQNLVYKNNPLFAMLNKYEKFGGDQLKQPLIYGDPQGRSATFSYAQSNQAPSALKAFFLSRVRDYATASIANETLKASEGNENAFLEAAELEINGALHSISRSLAIALYRNGSGSIGRLANTAFATHTWTLVNADDITNFEINQAIVVSGTDGGGTVRTGVGYIVAIDRDLGTFQCSATTGGAAANIDTLIPAVAASDYIFTQGDYGLKVSGLDAWLVPSSALTATPFFGVDRTSDKTRLAGVVQDGRAKPIEEAIIDLVTRVNREGGRPDTFFCDHTDWANLEKALGSKVQYVDVKPNYDLSFAFKGIAMNTPHGIVKVLADVNATSGWGYALQMDTWRLNSLGKAPTLFDTDGLTFLRQASADGVELRVYSYHQLGCSAPGWNGKVQLR